MGKFLNYMNEDEGPRILDVPYPKMTKEEFGQKVKDAMKQLEKWHFINAEVNGSKIQLKFTASKKDVYVQVFKKDGVHVHMPRNYSSRKDTLAMFDTAISEF